VESRHRSVMAEIRLVDIADNKFSAIVDDVEGP
jgi:hypothetical protein